MASGDNPYQSPDFRDPVTPQYSGGPAGASVSPMLSHVRVVSILMIVQGILECLMGLMLLVGAAFMPMAMMMEPPPQQPGELAPATMGWIIAAMYGGMAISCIAPGVTCIIAGIKNYKFKGRMLAMIGMGTGLLTVFSCYCAPTAIALAVYGLIIYLNEDVAAAFARGEQGATPNQIMSGA